MARQSRGRLCLAAITYIEYDPDSRRLIVPINKFSKMTKEVNFDELVDRTDTDSNKWDKYHGTDILPLWVADSDFPVAAEIAQALHHRIDNRIFGYTHPSRRLTELVVERMQRLYQWQIRSEWLVWVPSVVGSLNLACRSVGSAGDSVFIPSVIYPPFRDAPELSERRGRPVPMLQHNRRWVIDFEWLEQNISAEARLYYFVIHRTRVGRCIPGKN